MSEVLPGPGSNIALRTLPNLRDLGGYATGDGRVVRRGQLYRSVLLGRLSDEDVARVRELDLQVIFDFRTAAEHRATPDRDVGARTINLDVLDSVLASVSAQIDGYLHAVLPVTDAALLESLRGKAVILARVRLRGRRNLDVVDPVELEWKAAIRWLEMVAEGKIPVSSGATAGGGEFLSGSFGQVFSDPDREISL